MKITVVSDTHLGIKFDVPEKFIEAVKTADLIIHCGDFVTLNILREFKKYAPLEAVSGNMDGWDVKRELEFKRIIEIKGIKIGIIHGSGDPLNLKHKVIDEFKHTGVKIICFGHSHTPLIEDIKGVLVINPGSLTDTRFAEENTFAVLEIKEGQPPAAEIIKC